MLSFNCIMRIYSMLYTLNYQVLLEECKYVKENIKTNNYTDMELES